MDKRFPVLPVVTLAAAIAGAALPRASTADSVSVGQVEVGRRQTPVRAGRQESLHGSSMAQSPDGTRLYVADTDTDALVTLDLRDLSVVSRHAVGEGPEQVVVREDGRIFVTLKDAGQVVAMGPDMRVVGRARVGVEPWGLALSPDGRRVYVTSAQSETLTALDTDTLRAAWTVDLQESEPRGVAVAPDGEKAYVVHVQSPHVSVVDLESGRALSRLALPGGSSPERVGFQGARHGNRFRHFDSEMGSPFVNAGGLSGVPNRAIAAMVSPDGRRLLVPFDLKSSGGEIPLGQRTGGYGAGVSTPILAVLASIPIDGSDQAATITAMPNLLDPSDLRASGRTLYVTGAGPFAMSFDISNAASPQQRQFVRSEYAEAIAPVGDAVLAWDPIAFQVRKYDPARVGNAIGSVQVSDDPFPAEIAAGRRFFHQRSTQVSESSLACQSCHPDGRQDGITWNIDLGPRQTPILAGHLADTAPYHWLGSAATIEASIRETIARLGGSGLGEGEVSQIARFLVDGLKPVPNPSDARQMTPIERRGQALFASTDLGCTSCHNPERGFTDGSQRVLGPAPERGESAALRRFDTPSLRDLRASAPYLHDGSAPDLESVLVAFNHDDRMGRSRHLSGGDLTALVAYLETL